MCIKYIIFLSFVQGHGYYKEIVYLISLISASNLIYLIDVRILENENGNKNINVIHLHPPLKYKVQ